MAIKRKTWPLRAGRQAQSGFSLVELLVGIVITSIIMIGIYATYSTNRKTVMTQRQVADLQQQLRGSLYTMERDIRAAGFDPTGAATAAVPAGVADIQKYAIAAEPALRGALDNNGSPALTVRFDSDSNGVLETYTYFLYDFGNDGIVDLARTTNIADATTYQLVAEGIQAIGFAYAIDDDEDGNLDTINPANPNSNLIWAVDTDNDNLLDSNLDVDDDGIIDSADLMAGPAALAAPVALNRIRMVRFWLLSRSTRPAQATILDTNQYVIGDQIIAAANDNIRRRTVMMSVKCRNLGL